MIVRIEPVTASRLQLADGPERRYLLRTGSRSNGQQFTVSSRSQHARCDCL